MFKHILCPIDGSACSLRALDVAARLAHEQKAQLTICYVLDPAKAAAIAFGDAAMTASCLDALQQEAQTVLTHAAVGVEHAVRADTARIEGYSVDAILDYARRNECDLIVMGSHGRGGIERALLGSVAEGVLRRSDVPVLIVRFHETAAPVEAQTAAQVSGSV